MGWWRLGSRELITNYLLPGPLDAFRRRSPKTRFSIHALEPGALAEALKKDLAEATNLIVAQFKGITVAQDTDLRGKIRATNSKYRVVKNTLARIAPNGPMKFCAGRFGGDK